ncbi:MAG: hypothetical protein WCG23_11385 [bacterium]
MHDFLSDSLKRAGRRDSIRPFLSSLKHLIENETFVDAQERLIEIIEKTGFSKEYLYDILDYKVEPSFHEISKILMALDYKLMVQPIIMPSNSKKQL